MAGSNNVNLKEFIVRARVGAEWETWSLDENELTSSEVMAEVKGLLKENNAFVLQQIVDYPDVIKYNKLPMFKLSKLGLV